MSNWSSHLALLHNSTCSSCLVTQMPGWAQAAMQATQKPDWGSPETERRSVRQLR